MALIAAVIAIGCASLGVWQLDRHFARKARNAADLAQLTLPVIDLNKEWPSERVLYRRAVVTGRYDFDREFVIRLRLLRGTPGVYVITPLRIAGRDTAVLVNRGFVPTPDASYPIGPERYREGVDTTIDAVANPIPDDGDGAPLRSPRGETWRRLDLTAMRERLPYPIAPFHLVAVVDTNETKEHTPRGTKLPVRTDPPRLDEGPHLSYALQWFFIGATALGFGLLVLRGRNLSKRIPD